MKPTLPTLIVCLALGCGTAATPSDAGPDADFTWHALTDSACNARVRAAPLQSVEHVAPGTVITWNTNPPSSGQHEGLWARWGFATSVIPRNNWVHNLEHGGVLLLYQCPDATCPNATALRQVAASLNNDPACLTPEMVARPRVLVTPDPLITRAVSAVAWGHIYEADCVEPEALREFYNTYLARAPENTCAEGFVP